MTELQAIDVIKQVLDIAVQRGNFQNAEGVSVAIQAYSVILEKLKSDNKTLKDATTE